MEDLGLEVSDDAGVFKRNLVQIALISSIELEDNDGMGVIFIDNNLITTKETGEEIEELIEENYRNYRF